MKRILNTFLANGLFSPPINVLSMFIYVHYSAISLINVPLFPYILQYICYIYNYIPAMDGCISAIAMHRNEEAKLTKIVVTSNTTGTLRHGATRIVHFNLKDTVITGMCVCED